MRRSFDNLARSYATLERLLFARSLERIRWEGLAALDESRPQRALVLGDGDGRFSRKALAENAGLSIDSIERSSGMRRLARKRIEALGVGAASRYRSISGDALFYPFPISQYDLVYTQFFLDCFSTANANLLLGKISQTLKPGGQLVYADFSVPVTPPARWAGSALVFALYRFFRLTTDIEAKRLPALEWPRELRLESSRSTLGGLLLHQVRTRID